MTSISSQLAYLSLSEAANLIAKRELSPVELTQAMLDRISALDPKLHSYYTVFSTEALAAAREAEAQIRGGNYRGPLHGMPLAVKDIYESGPTTCGSKLRRDYVAQQDCTVVRKFKQAGGVMLGKLATYEFALGLPTLASYFQPARNPWNLEMDPGGSSSGSGAALAAGLTFGAMGSDTGGSIRWPAFCCGIVGMKATYGRVSRAGVFPLSWNLDHTGPMTRTVKDCALMLQECAGYDPHDPASARVPVTDFSAKLGQDLKGMRIGVPRKLFEDNCDKEILAAFDKAVTQMTQLGAAVTEVDSITFAELWAVFWPLICADAAAYHLEDLKKRPSDYNPDLRMTLAAGVLVSATAYLQAQRVREQIRRKMLKQLEAVDLFMLPTTGMMPARIRAQSPGMFLMAENFYIYTPLCNLTGFPALALPCGFSAAGLPIGFQLAGKPFDEATVFQAGHAYEQSTSWHQQHPAL
ncbi:MAG TPA: amidase [Candidatus Binatia bacterium]|jgi:aspartyl-tRNA(Asn)/glutamyl-tRNA(Gln) amidotransferase subunit A|nr:amidase [Candidatus Binatia bacterium]